MQTTVSMFWSSGRLVPSYSTHILTPCRRVFLNILQHLGLDICKLIPDLLHLLANKHLSIGLVPLQLFQLLFDRKRGISDALAGAVHARCCGDERSLELFRRLGQ